jgi:hypothetical protein
MNDPQEFVAGLHEMADFLEAHPSLIPSYQEAEITLFCHEPEEFAAKCRELGRGEKNAFGDYLALDRFFGPHKISVNISKSQTCEKVQTGTRVKKVVVPTAAIPVAQQEDALVYEVEEPVWEWSCKEESWLNLNLGKEEVTV